MAAMPEAAIDNTVLDHASEGQNEDLLTAEEHEAIGLLGQVAGVISRIIRSGQPEISGTGTYDQAEMVAHIHDLQHMVMAQAAARAYPNRYRLLGRSLETLPSEIERTL